MATDPDVLKAVKEIILDHRGADDAISSREINDRLGLDNIGSFPNTRAVVRKLIMEEQIPIASNSNGYYVVETEDELAAYLDRLESRMMSIADRKYAVRRAAAGWDEPIASSEDEDLI